MRRTGLAVAVLAVSLAAASPSPPAAAMDHGLPRTFLTAEETTQRGRLRTFCWISASLDAIASSCAYLRYAWPKAERVGARSEAVVFLQKAVPPEDLSLRAWREVKPRGNPKGPGREVAFRLAPAVRDGELGWAAAFSLPRKPGHYYLRLFGRWTDEEGTFGDQHGEWIFHLKLR